MGNRKTFRGPTNRIEAFAGLSPSMDATKTITVDRLIDESDVAPEDGWTATELADYLLNEAKVALVPGSAFGAEGYLRISYATSMEMLDQALARIAEALG